MFLGENISEHNFRAVGSKHPEKSARHKAKDVRKKCQKTMQMYEIQELVQDVNWSRDVETSASYINAVNYVKHLYQTNDEFRKDIQESAYHALVILKKHRDNNMPEESSREHTEIDLEEGVEYPLRELAFFSVIGDIYEGCEEVVFVYNRRWPVLEKYFDGIYDGISKPGFGFYVLE